MSSALREQIYVMPARHIGAKIFIIFLYYTKCLPYLYFVRSVYLYIIYRIPFINYYVYTATFYKPHSSIQLSKGKYGTESVSLHFFLYIKTSFNQR